MILNLYAVLDQCSGVYDGPVPLHNDKVAMRQFAAAAQKEGTAVNNNPSDFSIWRVGRWNDATGEVETETKVCIAYAVDLLIKGDNSDT